MNNLKKKPRICTECGTQTQWKSISIDYSQNKVKVRISGIVAMVCPNCRTEYLPGQQAIILSKAVDEILHVGLRTKLAA